jgi:O-methyltransferase
MKKSIGKRLFRMADSFARKIPSQLLSFISMPVGYQMSSRDASVYESTRMINLAFSYCMNNKIPGDYTEFGVYEGRASREAYKAAMRNGFSNIQFYVFDSFAGLPEVTGVDAGAVFHEGQFACSRADYEKNLRKDKINLSKFEIIEGYFDQTLPGYRNASQVAIAWIDCDLYESTVTVLDFLTDRMVNGSLIIFDDWFCFEGGSSKGEQLACKEWLEKNPDIVLTEYQKFHWAGISFIVNRKKNL